MTTLPASRDLTWRSIRCSAVSKLVPVVATALAVGCGSVDPELSAADEEVAELSEAIINATESPAMAGVLAIQIVGQGNVRTGIQIGNRLVLASSAWMNWQTRPADLAVRSGAGEGNLGTTLAAAFVNSSDYYPASIIQIASTPGNRPAIDSRSGPQLVGVVLRCFEYQNRTTLRAVDVSVTAESGNTLTASPTIAEPGSLQTVDYGAPCLDLQTGTAVGFLSGQSGNVSTIYRLATLQPWIDGMTNLAEVRSRAGSAGPIAFYNTPSGNSRFCLDIPWGGPFPNFPLNQYPCHYGPAQRFWLDYSVDPDKPRMVSDSSGLCIDVPSGSSADGVNLQQYPCHTGANQRFEMTFWGDAVGGLKLRPVHAIPSNRCLSVEGGPSTVNGPVPAEQRTCANSSTNLDQRWFMSFR